MLRRLRPLPILPLLRPWGGGAGHASAVRAGGVQQQSGPGVVNGAEPGTGTGTMERNSLGQPSDVSNYSQSLSSMSPMSYGTGFSALAGSMQEAMILTDYSHALLRPEVDELRRLHSQHTLVQYAPAYPSASGMGMGYHAVGSLGSAYTAMGPGGLHQQAVVLQPVYGYVEQGFDPHTGQPVYYHPIDPSTYMQHGGAMPHAGVGGAGAAYGSGDDGGGVGAPHGHSRSFDGKREFVPRSRARSSGGGGVPGMHAGQNYGASGGGGGGGGGGFFPKWGRGQGVEAGL